MIELAFTLTWLSAALASKTREEDDARIARVLVMRDRALELGYDCEPGLTPAWTLPKTLHYRVPPEWLDEETWNRELRLWACDCAERALPIWEQWTETHASEVVRAQRNAIETSRRFAIGKASLDEMFRAGEIASSAAFEHQISPPEVRNAAWAAVWTSHNPNDTFSANRAAEDAAYAIGGQSPERVSAEKKWQRRALAERLDRVAPWRFE